MTDAWTEKLDELAGRLVWLREQVDLHIARQAGGFDVEGHTRHAVPRGDSTPQLSRRPRWSPRKRMRLFGGRAFGVVLNLSRGKQDGPGPAGLIRGFLHSGWSLSFNLLGATFNTRGRYSIDGPGIADFRGTWKTTPTGVNSRTPRVTDAGEIHGAAPRRARGTATHLCGMRWHGGAPCTLPAGHEGEWHFPSAASGEPGWTFTADTRRAWWRR